jgi:hypothetical protein
MRRKKPALARSEGVGRDPARYEAIAEGMKQALAVLPQRHAREGCAG